MKKILNILVIVILGLTLLYYQLSNGGSRMDKIILFYLPFNAETFLPVTMDNMENQVECKFMLPKASQEVASLQEIFEDVTRGGFDNLGVRLKVVGLSHDDIFVDQVGGVWIGKVTWNLSSKSFAQLKSLLEELRASQGQGCKVKTNVTP